jgi:hypothetical protein
MLEGHIALKAQTSSHIPFVILSGHLLRQLLSTAIVNERYSEEWILMLMQ